MERIKDTEKNDKATFSSQGKSKATRIRALAWWNRESRRRLSTWPWKNHFPSKPDFKVEVLTHSPSLSIWAASLTRHPGNKNHWSALTLLWLFSDMDDFKWIPTLHTGAFLSNTYIRTHIHLLIKSTFLRFMCLCLVWEQWKQNISTNMSNNFLWNSLWSVLLQAKLWMLSWFFFFPLSALPSSKEIALTVTYMHNSSYVLFMAFQQLCNPRGWKYFPFATVTRAAERKYEQLQASLIMGSDNTLFRISVYHFSLKEKAGLLYRHFSVRLPKDHHTLDQKRVLRNETSLHCLAEGLSPIQNQPILTAFFWTKLNGFKLAICALCKYSEFSPLQLNKLFRRKSSLQVSETEVVSCRSLTGELSIFVSDILGP